MSAYFGVITRGQPHPVMVADILFSDWYKLTGKIKMKRIKLDSLKDLLRYDPLSGDFTWLVNKGPKKIGDIAGAISENKEGYQTKNIMINRKLYIAARLAWFYMTGKWPNQIDHINHDSIDNRWENLRNVSNRTNTQNRKLDKRNKSGMTGVVFFQGKWLSTIGVNYKLITLYRGYDFDKACEARRLANIEHGFHENHGARSKKGLAIKSQVP